MVALTVLIVVGSFIAFMALQVVLPLLFNRPILSWFRSESRLDKVHQQIRVATKEAAAVDAEQVLHEFLDDRIERLDKR